MKNSEIMAMKSEMRSILDSAKAENRSFTAEEKAKLDQLGTEIEAESRMASAVAEPEKRNANLAFAEAAVEAAHTNSRIQLRSNEEITVSEADPFVKLGIGDIIAPLEKGMILDKLGCKIQSGLQGEWKYPVLAAIEATVAGETAAISDSDLAISVVKPTPQRTSIAVPVTYTALSVTNSDLRDTVVDQLVKGCSRTLNKWMFGTSAIATGVEGPFVNPTTSAAAATSGKPTYAEICALKGAVDATGVQPDETGAYVMNNTMKAYLEATPKVAGAAGMICEGGKINGVPVYVTEYAPANTVEFGYFSYALVGQFGEAFLIVDQSTLALQNQVRFVLNTNFDIKAARAQAFGKLA